MLRSAVGDDRVAPSVEKLVTGMIAAHSEHSSLHHVLLEEIPLSKKSKKAHEQFEREYQQLYTRLVAGPKCTRSALNQIQAQVLSAAIQGAIHDGARRGTLESPMLKYELVSLSKAYLECVTGTSS